MDHIIHLQTLLPCPTSNRSIGDVFLGLHGGKYQFGSTGIYLEGQQFAESGYGSSSIEEEDYNDEPIPNWALKMKEVVPNDDSPELQLSPLEVTRISIQNEERSWEKYYAFVVSENGQCQTSSVRKPF